MKLKEDKFIKVLIIVLVPLLLISIVADDILLSEILKLRMNFLDQLFVFLSLAFKKGIIFLFVFLLLFKQRKLFWPWIFSAALSQVIVFALKIIIAKPRPNVLFPFIKNLIPAAGFSFPSGHTALAFAAIPVLVMVYPKHKWLIFILASLFSLSRVYLGIHYVSDILAGMFVGLICSTLILLISHRYKKK